MRFAIPAETRDDETRVAVVPEIARRFREGGATVAVQSGAGIAAGFPDSMYVDAGAEVRPSFESCVLDADAVLKVQRPTPDEVVLVPEGASLFCLMAPYFDSAALHACAMRGVTAFALELMPRITRAQSMDVLSSQSNLSGYRAVIEAVAVYGRMMPMMMTAAGTIAPARVFVMGAGVAGLQAIATARRLGAVVTATDVRPAAKEQVASLGAEFIAVEDDEFRQAETAAGYAKPMSQAYMEKQAKLVAEHLVRQDIVITTALIPGRAAPKLLSEKHVRSMRPGSVIVDIAVEQGGNCALSRSGEIVDVDGVKLIGYPNLPGRVAADASMLFSRNIWNFVSPMMGEGGSISIDWDDELVRGTCLTNAGKVIHPDFRDSGKETEE